MFFIPFFIAVLALVTLLMVASYARARREVLSADAFRDLFRVKYGMSQCLLADGVTTFQVLNPSASTTIIITHGLSMGALTYLTLARCFARRGYRVVVFDGFGRGLSDRIATRPVDMDLLVRQLLQLLNHLGVERTAIYGTSLGAAVAAAFVARHPDRAIAVGFEAPHIRPSADPALHQLVAVTRYLPPLGRWLARVSVVPLLLGRGEKGVVGEEAAEIANHFERQFEVVGHQADLLSMLTGDPIYSDHTGDHAAIGAHGTPVHFSYATDDSECPPATTEAAIALHRSPSVATYTGGHFFSSGRDEEMAEDFDRFLRAAVDVVPAATPAIDVVPAATPRPSNTAASKRPSRSPARRRSDRSRNLML